MSEGQSCLKKDWNKRTEGSDDVSEVAIVRRWIFQKAQYKYPKLLNLHQL